MRKKIPSGRVFQQAYRDRHGKLRHTRIWYLKYYVKGKAIVISSGTRDHEEAVTLLRQRMARITQQEQFSEYPERVRMNQLFDLLLDWYRLKERRSTYDVERKIESRLRTWWGKMKAQDVTSGQIRRYVESRRRERKRPENATINRELAYVRRAMKLGADQDPPLVLRIPHFEMLPESNVREGTVTHEQYRKIRDLLPKYARIALVIAYHTGVRKGVVRKIQTAKVDLKAGRIELPTRTMTGKPRPKYLPIFGDMAAEIEMAIAAGDPKCPFLIQDEGKPVQDWEKSWATACELADVPEALFHDLRRTALTNMIEAGLSEKEAMEISGHRTRAVFDRYHIVSERRLREMAGKLEVHLKGKEQHRESKNAVQ